MELFSVNRYVDDKSIKGETNEDEILQNLLKKVEKRKRRKIKTEDVNSSEVEAAEEKKFKQDLVKHVESDENNEVDPIYEGVENQVDVEKQIGDVGSTGDFAVLGEENNATKRQSLDMILPSWLAHPTVISTNIAQHSKEEGDYNVGQMRDLTPNIRGALKEMNITKLFPVQLAVIPCILESHSKPAPFRPRDICVSAPTGSGKTLAFAIPVVQLLSQRVERKIRALVILPVAELAHQVFKVFKKLCDKTDLTVCLLSTQVPFHIINKVREIIACYKN